MWTWIYKIKKNAGPDCGDVLMYILYDFEFIFIFELSMILNFVFNFINTEKGAK